MLKAFKEGARPFGIYVLTVAVAGGLYAPFVTIEKLTFVGLLLGGFAGLRSYDKRRGPPTGD